MPGRLDSLGNSDLGDYSLMDFYRTEEQMTGTSDGSETCLNGQPLALRQIPSSHCEEVYSVSENRSTARTGFERLCR